GRRVADRPVLAGRLSDAPVGCAAHRSRHRHLPREPLLRSPVRSVPGRQRPGPLRRARGPDGSRRAALCAAAARPSRVSARARDHTLADNYVTAAFGGSWLNHMWLICACAPVFPNAPAEMRAEPRLDASGRIVGLARDGDVTPDGFAVNDLQPWAPPYQAGTPGTRRLPAKTAPPITERLAA